MNEIQFIETIKVLDGTLCNLPLHMDRMNKTMMHFFNTTAPIDLFSVSIPDEFKIRLAKCRVVYSQEGVIISFEPYIFRHIKSLRLIEDGAINYVYKSTDRRDLNRLLSYKGQADEILIIKNGLVTDTSYTNVVFENRSGLYTPDSSLLDGTKRQLLLQKGIIKERTIRLEDIPLYDKIYLINAMIDIEDEISVSCDNLVYKNKKPLKS